MTGLSSAFFSSKVEVRVSKTFWVSRDWSRRPRRCAPSTTQFWAANFSFAFLRDFVRLGLLPLTKRKPRAARVRTAQVWNTKQNISSRNLGLIFFGSRVRDTGWVSPQVSIVWYSKSFWDSNFYLWWEESWWQGACAEPKHGARNKIFRVEIWECELLAAEFSTCRVRARTSTARPFSLFGAQYA